MSQYSDGLEALTQEQIVDSIYLGDVKDRIDDFLAVGMRKNIQH